MAFNSFAAAGNGALPPPPNPPIGLAQAPPSLSLDQQQLYQQQMHQFQQQFQQMQQLQQQFMGPVPTTGVNDQPLDFNQKRNKPPSALELPNGNDGKRYEDEKRDDRDRDRRSGRERDRERRDHRWERDRDILENEKSSSREDSNSNPGIPPSGMGMPMVPMSGMMGGMVMGPGMMPMMPGMDPSAMVGMGQLGMLGMGDNAMTGMNNMMGEGMFPQRTVIDFKSCSLYPPSPNAPPPITRDRPPGCRTIYVGGLPDKSTEEILREIFESCGEVLNVRLSKRNFCHIRFAVEASVDAAMLFSGYRMRIGNSTDVAFTGRLHVDYAQARADQYEFECKQRSLMREQRHRERVERERLRPSSPPAIPHYSDHEAGVVAENMKTDDGFKKSAATVVAWLERGELTKRNNNSFYSMIQSTYSHVRRLLNEKIQFEDELRAAKDLHRSRVHTMVAQFEYIEKVFTCASLKKCWDHFTKAQRKNIEAWKKQSNEIKQLELADGLREEGDEEMELSDEDEGPSPKKRSKPEPNVLKDENDSLKWQLEAYKNEVDTVRSEFAGDIEERDQKIKMLQQTLQNMSNEIAASAKKLAEEKETVKRLIEEKGSHGESSSVKDATDSGVTSDKDAKLIGLISTFLHVHPFGAGVDYIWSYLSKLDPSVKVSEVETLLGRFPAVFRQELCGIGATYHEWMQSPELLEATGSERLTLEEEYEMQKSWRDDEDKLTFIILDQKLRQQTQNDSSAMVGDINLFMLADNAAELMIMIAEPEYRKRGYAREALNLMMNYARGNFPQLERFEAKIGMSNLPSIHLFERMGFQKSAESAVFREVTMILPITKNSDSN